MEYLNYNENDYGEILDDIPYDYENDYDKDSALEELSFYPQNKFLKLVNFDIIKHINQDSYSDTDLGKYYHTQEHEEEIALALFDHPFGTSSILDKAYQGLSASIKQQEKDRIEECSKKARDTFGEYCEFQCQERSTSCPVCLDETFQECKTFYRCSTCQGGICEGCGPLITHKCPLCNIKQPLQKVCLKTLIKQERRKLKPSLTVRQLVYQKMYCPEGSGNKTIFGHQVDMKFNIENLSSIELDYEIAEFLRYTQKLLADRKYVLDESTYQEELDTKYWWARHLEPLFNL